MAAGNNTLEETFGLVAAGTEILRQPGRVANGLSTITARLTAQNDEYIASITGGMGTIDKNTGELRSTFDVLQDLSKAWENLTSVEKQELTEVVASKTQRSLFTALMSNFSTAVGATEAALNSEGSALEENNKRMDSLNGKLTQLQSAWQSFARNTINSQVVKSLLDLGTTLIKLADTDLAKFITKLALVTASLKLANKGYVSLTSTIITNGRALYQAALQASGVSTAEALMSAQTLGLAGSAKILTTALLTNPLFVAAGVAVGIYGIVKAVDALNVTFDEQIDKVNEASDSYDEAKSSLEKNTTELENKKKQLEEIETLEKSDPTNKYELQKKDLETEIKTLEAKQRVLENIAKEEKEALNREAKKSLTTKTRVNVYSDQYKASGGKFSMGGSPTISSTENVTVLEKINKEIENYNKLINQKDSLTRESFSSDKKFAEAQENYQNVIDETKKSILDTSKSLIELKGNLDENDEVSKQYIEQIDSAVNKVNDWYNGLNTLSEEQETQARNQEYEIGLLNEQNELLDTQTNKILEDTKQNLSDIDLGENNLIDTTSEYVNVVNSLTNELDLLNQAYGEQATNGSISLDTALDLISTNADYIDYLTIEEGQIYLNAGAQELLNKQKIETAQQNIVLANIDLIGKYANEENATKDLAGAYAELAAAKEAAAKAGDTDSEKALSNVQKQLDLIKNLESNPIFKSGKQTGLTTRGYTPKKYTAKKTTSTKAAKEEYKATIDTLYKYENALDNAKEEVDKLSDAVGNTDNYEEQVKYINQLIEALNNQIAKTNDLKNAQANQIRDYINQLRNQGFAIDYNSDKNELLINNMEHLADFSGDTAKSLEKIINKIQSLNDNNRTLDNSVRSLTSNVKKYYDQLADIPEEKLKKFNELMDDFQQSQLDAVQDQITDIEEAMKKDPRLEALEKQIETLEKQNDTIDKQKEMEEKLLAVEEARQKLENQRKQKTLQVYKEGEGWIWTVDESAIKDAEDELKDAQDALNEQAKNDELDRLKEQKENIENSYQDQIDKLQNFLDEQNYLIDKSNREAIQSFDDLISKMREYGLDSVENLKIATDWWKKYQQALAQTKQTTDTLSSNGLIYSSATQDKITQAMSSMNPQSTIVPVSTNSSYDKLELTTGGQTIYISNIELPNVSNANEFVEALKDLPRLATTQSSQRK